MPSMMLFKRMTNLKQEKLLVENELEAQKEKLDDALFINEKLNE